uniref:Uncharacterized protein n=1 Tax=Nelumbo nucifera TaxID=4432 RepID=A0A822Z1T2_NELNU|nr:TPA_asm: hypothetical protein HUJ06_008282 [Nelumbo nucifera]
MFTATRTHACADHGVVVISWSSSAALHFGEQQLPERWVVPQRFRDDGRTCFKDFVFQQHA